MGNLLSGLVRYRDLGKAQRWGCVKMAFANCKELRGWLLPSSSNFHLPAFLDAKRQDGKTVLGDRQVAQDQALRGGGGKEAATL